MLFAKVPHFLADDLPNDRPFTQLEAWFQYDMDTFIGKERSDREYSRMWAWGRDKVARFISEIRKKSEEDSLSFVIKTDPPKTSQQPAKDQPQEPLKNSTLRDATSQKPATNQPEASQLFIRENKKEETFVQFWTLYPRKTNKADALKIWSRLNPSPETLSVIMTALDCQCKQPDWKKNSGQFIPHPSTWLNKRRWEDELTAQPIPTSSANMQRSRREELREQGLDL